MHSYTVAGDVYNSLISCKAPDELTVANKFGAISLKSWLFLHGWDQRAVRDGVNEMQCASFAGVASLCPVSEQLKLTWESEFGISSTVVTVLWDALSD